jgi:hypothetical protein
MNKKIFYINSNNKEVVHNTEWKLRYKTKIMKVQMVFLQAKIKLIAFVGLLHWEVKNQVFKKFIKPIKENLTWKHKVLSVLTQWAQISTLNTKKIHWRKLNKPMTFLTIWFRERIIVLHKIIIWVLRS